MRTKREYRSRDATEVAVLDALVDRGDEGMTVLELRTRVDAEIDALEDALASLKGEELISTRREEGRLVITPDDRVVPDPDEETADEGSLFERLRERFPL
jgi:DNA-binding transcriptional ArsR family regulator